MTPRPDPLAVLRHRCPHMPGEPCDCPDKDAALADVERLVEAAREEHALLCDMAEGMRALQRTGERIGMTTPRADALLARFRELEERAR